MTNGQTQAYSSLDEFKGRTAQTLLVVRSTSNLLTRFSWLMCKVNSSKFMI